MTKIRCGNELGIDLDQVTAWSKFKTEWQDEALTLYLSGGGTLCVSQKILGCGAFTRLHNLLIERFTIVLPVDLPRVEQDKNKDIGCNLVGELEDLPY
jgi:hypothetical protein